MFVCLSGCNEFLSCPHILVYVTKVKDVPDEGNHRILVVIHQAVIQKLHPPAAKIDRLPDLGIIVRVCPGRGDLFRRHISFLVPFYYCM